MKNNRVTIRLTQPIEKRIEKIIKKGHYMKKSELLREAIWLGLKYIERRGK